MFTIIDFFPESYPLAVEDAEYEEVEVEEQTNQEDYGD
jgi:hypothetical protein